MNLESLYKRLEKIKPYDEESRISKENLLKEIQAEILVGGKINRNIITEMKAVIKENNGRPMFQKIFTNKFKDFIITNGYFLLDFGKDINNIPKELQPYVDKKQEDNIFSYDKLKNQDNELKQSTIDYDKIRILLKYNKLHKDDIFLYRIDNVYVNPELLYSMLVLSGHKADKKINCEYGIDTAPINIEFDNCKMLLLPIKMDEERIAHQKKLEELYLKEV